MGIIRDLFRGTVILSFIAIAQEGCTVKQIATKAATVHQKGLSSYGGYSRKLIGSNRSWAK